MPDVTRRFCGAAVVDYTQPIDTGEIPESGAHFDVIVVGGGPNRRRQGLPPRQCSGRAHHRPPYPSARIQGNQFDGEV